MHRLSLLCFHIFATTFLVIAFSLISSRVPSTARCLLYSYQNIVQFTEINHSTLRLSSRQLITISEDKGSSTRPFYILSSSLYLNNYFDVETVLLWKQCLRFLSVFLTVRCSLRDYPSRSSLTIMQHRQGRLALFRGMLISTTYRLPERMCL